MNRQRKELLEALAVTPLPINLGPPNLTQEQLQCVSDMINDGWLEGLPVRNSSGDGFACIRVARIMDEGAQALSESKPISRVKNGISKATKVMIAILTFIALVLGIALSWKQLQEPSPSPPLSAPNPVDSSQPVESATNQQSP